MCPKSRVGVDNPWWTISVENWSIIWCPNGSSSHQIITSPPDGWPHIVMCDGAAGANANNHVMYHTQKYLKACSAHLFSENQSQKTSMFYRVGFPLTGFDPQERNFGLVLSHSCKWEIYVPVTFRSSLTPWRLDCSRWPEGPPWRLDCCRWPGLFGRTMFDPSSVLESVAVPPFSYGQVPLRGAED